MMPPEDAAHRMATTPPHPPAAPTTRAGASTRAADRAHFALRCTFDDSAGARRLLLSLASLLNGRARRIDVSRADGRRRDDLAPDEIAARTSAGLVTAITCLVDAAGAALTLAAHLEVGDGGAAVTLRMPITERPPVDAGWHQSDPDVPTRPPALALPAARGGWTLDAAHALVGLAAEGGGLTRAELRPVAGGPPRGRWSPAAVSTTTGARSAASAARAAAWFTDLRPEAPRPVADDIWWTRFEALLREASGERPEAGPLEAHLGRVFRIPFPWSIRPLHDAEPFVDLIPPPADVIGRLVPRPDRVDLAVRSDLEPAVLGDLLMHLCAHCEHRHVRPGDDWSHHETLDTLTDPTPHRVWDRSLGPLLDAIGRRPERRRVTALAECTPLEKAWLVLHAHIGRMTGEARTLHPAAEAYQPAAYQRQAAQRLVAQLEDHGGAMLCDGVGLGKTYVATTVMVHVAHVWRARLARRDRSTADDPLRITVLAPNTVVSTWRREAIPPLAAHGVPGATVRVISHSRLSRILPSSDILVERGRRPSDMAHLLLSDLVIVDEAHNFRSATARRTVVLRDLLRLQPRKSHRRKVLLLTATPVNNSLEDLRQQVSLLFSKPLWLNDNITEAGYRERALREVDERLARARASRGDAAATLIHGRGDARFSPALDFRDDLDFGVQIPRIGDYLRDQARRLLDRQRAVRDAMLGAASDAPAPSRVRVASELLDRVVVQRSRALCKQIEREQGSDVRLLFRPDAPPPEQLVYEDAYGDTPDVLARFLPLFDADEAGAAGGRALSLKVYMWADVRDGIRQAAETASVVGLQRILVLKRLESSPVAFLITLCRLLALHAHRLCQLLDLCDAARDRERAAALGDALDEHLGALDPVARDRLDLLLTGQTSAADPRALLGRWSRAHAETRPAADSDDEPPGPVQLDLLAAEPASADDGTRERLDRLWPLADDLTGDLATLLRVAPDLADIVFGRFAERDWPRRFIAGGEAVDWPDSPAWGLRIVTDAKLRRLVARLLAARRLEQKVIVFSQFTDTLAYIASVLGATAHLERAEWRLALPMLAADAGGPVDADAVRRLTAGAAVVSGETDDRDAVVNRFAPFYRLGPNPPAPAAAELVDAEPDDWTLGWTAAIERPIDTLLASDVLAEGVNLQDAALLINYDVHWNPVRMIQRAGRVDRRLNPAIEDAEGFPAVEALAARLGRPAPRYWWHAHPGAAPLTVNLLLTDALEAELQLRERIAHKTLAIDFTLGLEQGTGAEADWMSEYRYQGISALNAWQQDRAIEQIAGYRQRLRRLFAERGIEPEWVDRWNGWLRERGASDDDPIIAWGRIGRGGGDLGEYGRYLEPRVLDGVPHWLWTTARPGESLLNAWLVLDARAFPAATRADLPWSPDASRPIGADDLLAAAVRLVDAPIRLEERGRDIGRPIMQGAPAISAGFFIDAADRRAIRVPAFRLLQLSHLDPPAPGPATSEDPPS